MLVSEVRVCYSLAHMATALGHDKAQTIIDQITAAYEGGPPPAGGFGGPPPPIPFSGPMGMPRTSLYDVI
jgi:hypothetical protein